MASILDDDASPFACRRGNIGILAAWVTRYVSNSVPDRPLPSHEARYCQGWPVGPGGQLSASSPCQDEAVADELHRICTSPAPPLETCRRALAALHHDPILGLWMLPPI